MTSNVNAARIRLEIAARREAVADVVEKHARTQAARAASLAVASDAQVTAFDEELACLRRSFERGEAGVASLEAELAQVEAAEREQATKATQDKLRDLARHSHSLHLRYADIAGEMVDLLADMKDVALAADHLNHALLPRQRIDVAASRRSASPSNYHRPRVDEAVVLPGIGESDPAIWPEPKTAAPRTAVAMTSNRPATAVQARPVIVRDGDADHGLVVTRGDEEAWHAAREAAVAAEQRATPESRAAMSGSKAARLTASDTGPGAAL